ncbi:unnamed protein product [Adineta ricciae]|uniref:Uncharacterized protein n=1 Tax=Adineta ricciae TaxID=249248 RepID=A0A814H161_ADIRI|nr:unnamed protein product [Adineta ricciae]CAF1006227.1 unnamed protein product [Adineta ricciae]
MEDLNGEQQETEFDQSPDVESVDETTQIEQSQSKSLIDSLLFTASQQENEKNKKIKTSRQKELERLTKATKSLFSCCEELNIVCERIDSILSNHRTILLPVCRSLDKRDSGRLSYEQFRLIIRDHLPAMPLEDLFVLTKLFQINESIDYRTMLDDNINNGIRRFIKPSSVSQSSEVILETTIPKELQLMHNDPLQTNHSKCRYLVAYLRLITFDAYDAHPGHIYLTIPDRISIYTLSKLIIDETSIITQSISIFRENVQARETLLDLRCSLQSQGYIGADEDGTRNQQFPKYKLYYNYLPMNICHQCPILKFSYKMK